MGQDSLFKDAFWKFIFSVNHLSFMVALVQQNIYKLSLYHIYYYTSFFLQGVKGNSGEQGEMVRIWPKLYYTKQ